MPRQYQSSLLFAFELSDLQLIESKCKGKVAAKDCFKHKSFELKNRTKRRANWCVWKYRGASPFAKAGLNNKASAFCRASHPPLVMRWGGREPALLGCFSKLWEKLGLGPGLLDGLLSSRQPADTIPVVRCDSGAREGALRVHGPGCQGRCPQPPHPGTLSQSNAAAPSRLRMDFPILRAWPLSWRACLRCERARSNWWGIGPEMSREDLYHGTASPGANCAIGSRIMAPGENNPRLSCALLPPSPEFFFLFLFSKLLVDPGGLGGFGRGEFQRCPVPALQGELILSTAKSGSGFGRSEG